MKITEVRVKLVEGDERLMAFCSIILDGVFVVHDLKVVKGSKGMFVSMPCRKLTDHCPKCGTKNHLLARFCNRCGGKLDEHRAVYDDEGRTKLHADTVHPIDSDCRELIEAAILSAYAKEKELSRQPGYAPNYYDCDIIPHLKEVP